MGLGIDNLILYSPIRHMTTTSGQTDLLSMYYIQGDSGGICTTLGDDSMSDSKQKSSYEHGSDF
jgi:hypothetical protein